MAEKDIYRIAFFTVDWNYELVEDTLHGLKQYVDDHRDISLSVFDCFGKDLDNAKDKSEYMIFQLPDFSRFDGLLIQGNQIVLKRIRKELIVRIIESGIPAVTLGCPLTGCTLVTMDNRAAQHDIADHVIRVHKARRLVYLTGILSNDCPEAQQRLDGFLDACRENRIPEENIEILKKTWRISDGKDVARQWLHRNRKLPDAFICANDDMALGLMEALQEAGVRIPQDVIVTGYDNLTSAELSSPRLSTVACNQQNLNYMAMDVLLRKIHGEQLPSVVSAEYKIITSESCGCSNASRPGLIRDKYFRQTRFLKSFYNVQDRMAEELFEANTLRDLTETVIRNRAIFGGNDIYLCINDYYFDNYDKNEWTQNSETYGEEMVLALGKDDSSCSKSSPFIRFPTRDLLPEPYRSKERFLMFYPLHYNTYSIGYIAIDGISEAAKMNLHESIFNFVEIAIENVRKKELLRRFNEMLDDLYVHDGLTGLYNRFGFDRYASETYDRLMRRHGSVQVLFTDLDDMKQINDEYGHDLGDTALRAVARIMKENCEEGDFLMRYGGDEFVIIANGKRMDLESRILAAADAYNSNSGMPFKLGFSIGTVRAVQNEGRSLDECIREADILMYQIKTDRKVGR